METKDWILLFVPIASNILLDGILLFILNKIFEKRKSTHSIKLEYVTSLRYKIDEALHFYSNAIIMSNSKPKQIAEVADNLNSCKNKSIEIYQFYLENDSFLKHFEQKIVLLSQAINTVNDVLLKLKDAKTVDDIDNESLDKYFTSFNHIYAALLELKTYCVKF